MRGLPGNAHLPWHLLCHLTIQAPAVCQQLVLVAEQWGIGRAGESQELTSCDFLLRQTVNKGVR